jgi:hypothetical protein
MDLQRRLSIVRSAREAMHVLAAEEEAIEWASTQLRQGAVLPPPIVIGLLDKHLQSCKMMRAHTHLVATLVCAALDPECPPLPWWRRMIERITGRR